jgi:hypothetical protein
MSGGHFDYNQYQINDIADEIDSIVRKNGKELTKNEIEERYGYGYPANWLERYPEARFHYKYPDEVIKEFKKAVKILRKAAVYAHRVDWLLSGDDDEDSFIKRLKEDLSDLSKKR